MPGFGGELRLGFIVVVPIAVILLVTTYLLMHDRLVCLKQSNDLPLLKEQHENMAMICMLSALVSFAVFLPLSIVGTVYHLRQAQKLDRELAGLGGVQFRKKRHLQMAGVFGIGAFLMSFLVVIAIPIPPMAILFCCVLASDVTFMAYYLLKARRLGTEIANDDEERSRMLNRI